MALGTQRHDVTHIFSFSVMLSEVVIIYINVHKSAQKSEMKDAPYNSVVFSW